MSNPCNFANSSAPSPDKKTCSDFSITNLAADIGFFIVFIPEIAPAFKFFPFIIDASISTTPLFDKTDPFPALNNSEFSRIFIVSSTASLLDPFFSKILYPALIASSSLSL